MKRFTFILTLIFVSFGSLAGDSLRVGLNVAPPFVMNKDEGLCIDFLNNFLKGSEHKLSFHTYNSADELVKAIADGNIDLGVGPTTINAERYKKVNFSQPFFTSTIGIALKNEGQGSLGKTIISFFNFQLLEAIFYLFVFFLLFGSLFWFFEKDTNDNFSKKTVKGIWDGFYYAVITFTTVGYGDKSCLTRSGKIITLIFALLCMGIGGIFIANVSSAITVSKLEGGIDNLSDLNKKKVGTVKGSTSISLLESNDVRYIPFKNAEEGLVAMNNGELEAFVYDTPILQYLINEKKFEENIILSDKTYDPQFYGLAYSKDNDSIADQLSPFIVGYTKSDKWHKLLKEYSLE